MVEKFRNMPNDNQYNKINWIMLVLLAIPLYSSTNMQYIIIFSMVLIGLLFGDREIVIKYIADIIPLGFIIVWAYGFLRGLLAGNNPSYVIQNFAGMTVYIFYYYLCNRNGLNMDIIYKTLKIASIVASIEIFLVYQLYTNGFKVIWPFSNIRYNIWTSSILSGIAVLPFVLEALSLWGIVHEETLKKRLLSIIQFILATASLIFTTDSAGYLLGYIGIAILIILASVLKNPNIGVRYLIPVIIAIIIFATTSIYEGSANDIFAPDASGNGKRYSQIDMVFENFDVFGRGLGANVVYAEGDYGDVTYGMEISYINIIDKFGLFAVVILASYIYSIATPISALIKGIGREKYCVMSIGLTGYLFVAVGNPVIFSPYNVVIHTIELYMIKMITTMSGVKDNVYIV